MIQAKCIKKFRDEHGNVCKYRLQDTENKVLDVNSDALKKAIINNQIEIINLTLTSDGRLVDKGKEKTNTQHRKFKSDEDIENTLVKAKMLGLNIKNVTAPDGNTYYIVYKQADEALVLIPSNVTYAGEVSKEVGNYNVVTIEVCGGRGLISTKAMFYYYNGKNIDLSELCTSNVVNMREMFSECKAEIVGLSLLDTSNVVNMRGMFYYFKGSTLTVNIDTSKVVDMENMFRCCMCETLDVSNMDTSSVKNMRRMFEYCRAKILDVSKFKTSRVYDMTQMFKGCRAEVLDLSNFDISNTFYMKDMLIECSSKIIKNF